MCLCRSVPILQLLAIGRASWFAIPAPRSESRTSFAGTSLRYAIDSRGVGIYTSFQYSLTTIHLSILYHIYYQKPKRHLTTRNWPNLYLTPSLGVWYTTCQRYWERPFIALLYIKWGMEDIRTTTVRNSRVLRTIPLLITICLFNIPAYAQYSGGSEAAMWKVA